MFSLPRRTDFERTRQLLPTAHPARTLVHRGTGRSSRARDRSQPWLALIFGIDETSRTGARDMADYGEFPRVRQHGLAHSPHTPSGVQGLLFLELEHIPSSP